MSQNPLRKQQTSNSCICKLAFLWHQNTAFWKSLSLSLLSMKEESTEEEREQEEAAALKIQSVFRGHVAREEVKKMKSDKSDNVKAEENN